MEHLPSPEAVRDEKSSGRMNSWRVLTGVGFAGASFTGAGFTGVGFAGTGGTAADLTVWMLAGSTFAGSMFMGAALVMVAREGLLFILVVLLIMVYNETNCR